jgi:hypothetical protein
MILSGKDIISETLETRRRLLKDKVPSSASPRFGGRPAVILQCSGRDDGVEAVRFAQSNKLLTAVRAGWHSVAGIPPATGDWSSTCRR